MDRPLDSSSRRRTIAKRAAAAAAILATAVGGYALAATLVTPKLDRARLRTSVVDRGPVEATTTASGTVVPEVERVVSSPIDARVVRILKRPGDAVRIGDPIVELDTAATALAIDKIDRDVALKANAREVVRLDLEKTLAELESRVATKRLDLESLDARLAQFRKLAASGLTSASDVRDAELAAAKARVELAELEASMANARASAKTKLDGLALEADTLRKDRDEAARQLALATMTADRDGILTWALSEEGATVARGAVVAKIADLRAFRVDATLSDVHAQSVAAGMPARVKINDEYLDGTVSAVLPTIQNGTMTIQIALADPSDARLKSNLRVDALVVTERRAEALRVRKGPFANGAGAHDVFVVRGDRAVRERAELGISDENYFEVVGGLAEGDEVVVSDTREYERSREVAIR